MASLMKLMGGEEKFNDNLKKRNINPETLRHDMEMEFFIHNLIKDQIEGSINVSDEGVKVFYDTNIEKFKRPESFHTRHKYPLVHTIFPDCPLRFLPKKRTYGPIRVS